MKQDVVKQLSGLHRGVVDPRPEWVANNRALLLAQIKNTVPEISAAKTIEKIWSTLAIFLPRPVMYAVVRPIAVLLLVAIVGTTAYTGVKASTDDTLPGDWLYPAKRVTEKTQVAMVTLLGDKNAETKLHVELASRRAVETRQISVDPSRHEKLGAAVADLKDEIKTINAKLDETKINPSTKADTVKDVKQNTEQIKNVLQEVKNNLVISGAAKDKLLSKEVSETKDLVKDVSVKAVEVLVAKHLEGDASVSKEDVKKAIDTTLQNVVNDVGQSTQTVAGAHTIVEAVKIEVKDLAGEARKQNNVGLTSSTKQMSEQVTAVANQAVAAVIKTETVTAEVGQKVTEAKALVGSGDLVKAIDKLKEVNQATKEVEKISDNTVENTQTILPIVQVIKDASSVSSTPGSVLDVSAGTKDIIQLVSTTLFVSSTGISSVSAAITTTPKLTVPPTILK